MGSAIWWSSEIQMTDIQNITIRFRWGFEAIWHDGRSPHHLRAAPET
jgi:hypothetical protein